MLRKRKKIYHKAEVNYAQNQTFRSMGGMSLPTFPSEFSVETASNRMIDNRSNKGFKAFNFHLFINLKRGKR